MWACSDRQPPLAPASGERVAGPGSPSRISRGEMDRILVVDDEPIVLEVLTEVLESEGFQVARATSGAAALEELDREAFALLLCDIRMPGMDGFELVREVRRAHPGTDVLMMTGFGSIDGAVEAMSLGAADYLIKPLKPKEIVARIRSILERRHLEAEIHKLQAELRARSDLHNVVANSPRMATVVSALRRIAPNEDPVFLCGERGTGRRFIARAIHFSSPRRDRQFHCVRCDLLSPRNAAPDLFGGSADGKNPRRGVFERFAAGTVHLHGVEQLDAALQAKLAETLRSGSFVRLGDTTKTPLRSRVLLSTEGTIAEQVEHGKLDSALSQLELVTVNLPPLRHRQEDLPGLVAVFLRDYAIERGQTIDCSPEAIEALANHEYDANVAQLFATLSHAATLSLNGRLEAETIARALRQGAPGDEPRAMAQHLGDREYQLVQHAVNRNPGRLDQAARELGVSRTTLWRRMRKYGIKAH